MGVEQPNTETHDRLVLVTGGAGFLGTRTVQQLRSAGHPVAVLDDGSGGTWQINVEGTRNLLDALTSCPPRRFLFASTAEVYR